MHETLQNKNRCCLTPLVFLQTTKGFSSCSKGKTSNTVGIPSQAFQGSESTSETIVPSSFPAKSQSRGGLASVAQLVKLGRCKNVLVVAGAGISTPSGIPDFRSVAVLSKKL